VHLRCHREQQRILPHLARTMLTSLCNVSQAHSLLMWSIGDALCSRVQSAPYATVLPSQCLWWRQLHSNSNSRANVTSTSRNVVKTLGLSVYYARAMNLTLPYKSALTAGAQELAEAAHQDRLRNRQDHLGLFLGQRYLILHAHSDGNALLAMGVVMESVTTTRPLGLDNVVLLCDGKPISSLLRDGLEYYPTKVLSGPGSPCRVRMEAPTLEWKTTADAREAKWRQLLEMAEELHARERTISQLEEAQQRSEAVMKEMLANVGQNEKAELSDLGALMVEQQTMKNELAKQEAQIVEKDKAFVESRKKKPTVLTTHQLSPSFELVAGYNRVRISEKSDQQAEQFVIIQVLETSQCPTAADSTFTRTTRP
jgi:hypothetical protein